MQYFHCDVRWLEEPANYLWNINGRDSDFVHLLVLFRDRDATFEMRSSRCDFRDPNKDRCFWISSLGNKSVPTPYSSFEKDISSLGKSIGVEVRECGVSQHRNTILPALSSLLDLAWLLVLISSACTTEASCTLLLIRLRLCASLRNCLLPVRILFYFCAFLISVARR